MASRSLFFALSVATLAAGCFDDALLRPATNDIGRTDVPVNPPDVIDNDAVVPSDAVVTMDVVADVTPDTAPADGADDVTDVVTTDVIIPDAPGPTCTLDRVLVTTSDFTNGGYALGRFSPTPSLVASGAMAPDQDHVPVQSGCVVYNLLRGNDVLAVFDTMNLPTIARRIPLRMAGAPSTPYQANPYDVYTAAPDKAYVLQYALPRIAIVDPTMDGAGALRGTIDLSPLRSSMDMDMSGSPEPVAILRAGRHLFVALQNLNAYTPVANGTLAVIDPTTDMLVDADTMAAGTNALALSGRNPIAMQLTAGGRLVVAEAGVVAFAPPQMLDGGIEVVDPATLRAMGFRVTEMQLGGDISGFVMLSDTRGWAVVTQLAMPATARVVEFDLDLPDGMRVVRTVMSTGSIGGIARDPMGSVWVLDRTMGRAGLRVFNRDGMETTMTPLSSGMYPPSGIAFVP